MPQVGGVDAITVGGAELVGALQTIVARKLAPPGAGGAVVSVTEFQTDGQRNVLPGRAVLKGDVRAGTPPEDRAQIETFMRQISDGVAAAHGGVKVTVDFQTEFVETVNAPEPVQAVYRAGEAAGCEVTQNRRPMSFSEDFAHFASAVPGCFLLLGNGTDGANGQPLHAADYDFNDDLLPIGGAEFWVQLVRDRLPQERD